jgi:molybdate transport system ATP-binding protein
VSLLAAINFSRGDWQLQADLELPATGVSAIYGPSGCGKTTLLRILAGLERSGSNSTIHLNGECWQDGQQFVPADQRGVGYVFQDGRLFPHLSVRDNLLFAFTRRFASSGPTLPIVCEWLQISELLPRKPGQLSGGEQQRVAIARALLSAPKLLLLDEPLNGLDPANRDKAMALLEDLHRKLQIPMIYVSHNLEEVMRLADYVVLLQAGRVQTRGTIENLSSALDSPLTLHAGAASVIHGVIFDHDQQYGLSRASIGENVYLYLQRTHSPQGARVRLRIRADAVSLSKSAAGDSSILNILPAVIEGWQHRGDSHVLVQLTLGQHHILASITRKSLAHLGLRRGDTVFAQIKGVALLSDYDNDYD